MPYVTSIERLARRRNSRGTSERNRERTSGRTAGRTAGRRRGRSADRHPQAAGAQVQELPAKHERKLQSILEIERLGELLQAANDAETLDEVLSLV